MPVSTIDCCDIEVVGTQVCQVSDHCLSNYFSIMDNLPKFEVKFKLKTCVNWTWKFIAAENISQQNFQPWT